MPNYDYFKQWVDEHERIKIKTIHDEHILQFQAMCSKMIDDAIPKIIEQCKQEVMRELKHSEKQDEIKVRVSVETVKEKITDAIRRMFR